MKRPNLYIVGHPRSGTSSLHYYLSQHPEVFMTAIKEPNYFAHDFRQDSDDYHRRPLYFPYRSESTYLRLYRNWRNEKIAGEATATNLCSNLSAQNIRRFNPEAKIIMLFREPVAFLQSYHSAARFALGEHLDDFETALAAEDDRRNGRVLSKRVIAPAWLFYSAFIKYSDQLGRYRTHFTEDQIKTIIFDDLRDNTAGTVREVLLFLGVDPDFTPELEIINPNKEAKWPRVKKYTLDSPYVRKALRFIFSDNGYAALKNFYKTKMVHYKPRPPLDQNVRIRLMRQFKDEVEKFGGLLDQDLISRWGYDNV